MLLQHEEGLAKTFESEGAPLNKTEETPQRHHLLVKIYDEDSRQTKEKNPEPEEPLKTAALYLQQQQMKQIQMLLCLLFRVKG